MSEENKGSFDEIYIALVQLAGNQKNTDKRNPIGYKLK